MIAMTKCNLKHLKQVFIVQINKSIGLNAFCYNFYVSHTFRSRMRPSLGNVNFEVLLWMLDLNPSPVKLVIIESYPHLF